jgi:hypothetical protein
LQKLLSVVNSCWCYWCPFSQISVIAPAPAAVLAATVYVTIADSAVVVASISPALDKEAASVEVIAALIAATVVLMSLLLLLPPELLPWLSVFNSCWCCCCTFCMLLPLPLLLF